MTTYDLAVIGLGAWGASTAWQAARDGQSVIGFDRHRPPHMYGSHSGTTRLARWSTSQHADYAGVTELAFASWSELEQQSGRRLLEPSGSVLVGPDDPALWTTPLETLRQLRKPFERMDAVSSRRRYPWLRVADDEQVLHEPEGVRIRSADAIRTLHATAKGLGAHLVTGTTVTGIEDHGTVVTVRTVDEVVTAKRVVITAGPWSADWLPDHELRVEQQVLVMFRRLDESVDWPCTYFASFIPGGEGYGYGALETDGTFKVAYHHGGATTTADDVDGHVSNAEVDIVINAVKARLPGLAPQPVGSAVCLYTNAPDDHFIVGPSRDSDRVWIAAAENGRGFRYATAIGAYLATPGRHRVPRSLTPPDRHVCRAKPDDSGRSTPDLRASIRHADAARPLVARMPQPHVDVSGRARTPRRGSMTAPRVSPTATWRPRPASGGWSSAAPG